jgi:repressor LexA
VNPPRRPGLTERQEQILGILVDWIREHGYPPTMRELGLAAGLSSTRSVSDHLVRLEELGFIRRGRDQSRAIEILRETPSSARRAWRSPSPSVDRVEVPIVGEVAAGSPILAAENIVGTLTLDPSMVRDSRAFFLRVRGNSMIEAHICDGDLVLVQPQQEARDGEIVVVRIDDDVTLKRFYRRDGFIELRPENRNMAAIMVRPEMGDVKVVGRAVGVWRSM